MKSFLKTVTILGLMISVLGLAEVQAIPQIDNLESGMKAMQSRLRAISKQVNDVTKNQSSATLAKEFAQTVIKAKEFVPREILNLPPQEQAVRRDLFESMMDDASGLGDKLAESFAANDNVAANQILGRLLKAKKSGHSEFKTEDN